MPKQNYTVEIEILTNHTFQIPSCNSPEEAISIATQELEEGSLGEMDSDFDIISTDAYPADEAEEVR